MTAALLTCLCTYLGYLLGKGVQGQRDAEDFRRMLNAIDAVEHQRARQVARKGDGDDDTPLGV